MSRRLRKSLPLLSYMVSALLVISTVVLILDLPKPHQPAHAADPDMVVFADFAASLGAGWTSVSDGAGEPFNNRYIRASGTYGTTGGSATHTHTLSLQSYGGDPSSGNNVDKNGTGSTTANQGHTHAALANSSITTNNNSPSYNNLNVYRYTAGGIPTTIPSGAILMFETTNPGANWELYTTQQGYYLRGSSSSGSGGNNTPSHTVASGLGVGTGTQIAGATGTQIPIVDHTHLAGSGVATDSPSIEPVFYELSLWRATANIAFADWPSGMIAGFSGTAFDSSNWTVVSDTGDTYNNYFLKIDNNGPLGTGGSANHSHANVSVSTGNDSGTIDTDTSPSNGKAAFEPHVHSITVGLQANVDHTPLYGTVVLAQFAPDYSPRMNNWQWYADEADETPGTAYAAETTGATPNEPPQAEMGKRIPLKLRINVTEIAGVGENDSRKELQWSTNQSAWTNVSEPGVSGVFTYTTDISGGADNVLVTTNLLTGTTQSGIHNESNSSAPSNSDHTASATLELEYAFEIGVNATTSTQYYFRLYDEVLASAIPLGSGKCYPSLTTSTAFDLSLTGPSSVYFGSISLGSSLPHTYQFTDGEKFTMRDNRGVMDDGWTASADITDLAAGSYTILDDNIRWISYTTDIVSLYDAPTTGLSGNTGEYMVGSVTMVDATASGRNGHGGFTMRPYIQIYTVPEFASDYSGNLVVTIL